MRSVGLGSLSDCWLRFAAVDFPSVYFQEQEDLHSSFMVQGPGLLSCKKFCLGVLG